MTPSTLGQLRRVLNMPWLATNELKQVLSKPFVQAKLRLSSVEYGSGCKFYGEPIVQRHRRSRIVLGDRVELRSSPTSNPLSPNHPVFLSTRDKDAQILIGNDCGLTGTTVVSEDRVEIGDRVAVGANATIVDTDFHPVNAENRRQNPLDAQVEPVEIMDDVFIGMNSLILKGVTIGEKSVIGAGSVVVSDVPKDSLVAGNPAKIITDL